MFIFQHYSGGCWRRCIVGLLQEHHSKRYHEIPL